MIKKKINIFLTSIEQNENKIFENNFVINQNKNLKKYVWGFSNSDKNLKIWENMNKGDWILFYFNSRYSYVGRIFKKQKSNLIAKKVFGNELQNKNLIIYCENTYKIKKGFQKTNSQMGFQSTIQAKHKIKLLQAKEKSVIEIIKKFESVEKYLEIKINNTISKEIQEITPSSMKKEPQKHKIITLRRIRDTVKSKKLKKLYHNKCQICNYSFPEYVTSGYSEVHHVWPMANNGDDDYDNMLVLCPNHHTEFDYRIIQFNSSKYRLIEDLNGNNLGTISYKKGHSLNKKNILFHNNEVRSTFFES